MIVTDSVFSMDGDVAPLEEIVELAQAAGARIVVDEAHAIGTSARTGAARSREAGLEGEVDAIVGTLGKSLGSYGAYVCGERGDDPLPAEHGALVHLLDRPAAAGGGGRAGGAGAAAASARTASSGWRANARALRRALAAEGFPVAEGDMHIVPLIVGEERDTMRLCQAAIERGVFAQAIRPPTVPAGTSRLRLAAMASHTASDMRMAAGVLAKRGAQARAGPGASSARRPSPSLRRSRRAGAGRAGGARRPAGARGPRPRPRPRRSTSRRRGRGDRRLRARADAAGAGAPFDGERESAVAHAA